MSSKLFSVTNLAGLELTNRVVMAPMTRCRAIDNIPNELMAEYYAQRAGAGLLITEGTAPAPNGLGYARIPGMYSAAQVEGWKLVTQAVHEAGGKIFCQLMHTGRVSHPLNMPAGAEVVAPSAVRLEGEQMYTDQEGMQDYPSPRAFRTEELPEVIAEYVQAAKNAIEAGFDGIELHGANGYLLEQFLDPSTNQREDNYGGNIENRIRFVVETVKAVADAIGAAKTGIRLSPYGAFNHMGGYDEIDPTYEHLAAELAKIGLAYIHLVDHSSMGAPAVPDTIKSKIQEQFGGTIILSGGYDKERAEADLEAGKGELIAFGRPFISNPDLVDRMKANAELAQADHNSFYTPGVEGYTDYPSLATA